MTNALNHFLGGLSAGALVGFGMGCFAMASEANRTIEHNDKLLADYAECAYVVPDLESVPGNIFDWKEIKRTPDGKRWCVTGTERK